jgi:protein arginine N-methyltransferase 1
MKYSLYSIGRFGEMMADHVRMTAYVAALERAVTPGCSVLDLGTGTGIFALLACRMGAGTVYAIDPDDSIAVAKESAVANGCDDRIRFLQAMSTEVVLDEKVDVIISDLRGVLPLFHHHIPSIVDARERLLRPGGVLIPQSDTLRAALVHAPGEYERYVAPWEQDGFGFDLQSARSLATNTWNICRIGGDAVLTAPQTLAHLDYATITDPNLRAEVTWTVPRSATAHGMVVWFDATLADGLTFTNAPGEPEVIYGRAFFPWTEPVGLEVGDTVTVRVHADLVGDDYLWRWDTSIDRGRGRPVTEFAQSELLGVPLDIDDLLKGAPDYTPVLAPAGEVDRTVLSAMDGTTTLAQSAQQLAEQFPDRFPSTDAALAHVRDLSRRYSR